MSDKLTIKDILRAEAVLNKGNASQRFEWRAMRPIFCSIRDAARSLGISWVRARHKHWAGEFTVIRPSVNISRGPRQQWRFQR